MRRHTTRAGDGFLQFSHRPAIWQALFRPATPVFLTRRTVRKLFSAPEAPSVPVEETPRVQTPSFTVIWVHFQPGAAVTILAALGFALPYMEDFASILPLFLLGLSTANQRL